MLKWTAEFYARVYTAFIFISQVAGKLTICADHEAVDVVHPTAITLVCVTDVQAASLSWTIPDGSWLYYHPDLFSVTTGFDAVDKFSKLTIKIFNVKSLHITLGDYICCESVSSCVNITVPMNPFVKRKISEQSMNVGDTLQITCQIFGYPRPESRWKRNHEILLPEMDPKVEITDRNLSQASISSTLIIRHIMSGETFVITCEAESSRGIDSILITYRVKSSHAYVIPLIIWICQVIITAAFIIISLLISKRKTEAQKKAHRDNVLRRKKKALSKSAGAGPFNKSASPFGFKNWKFKTRPEAGGLPSGSEPTTHHHGNHFLLPIKSSKHNSASGSLLPMNPSSTDNEILIDKYSRSATIIDLDAMSQDGQEVDFVSPVSSTTVEEM